MIRFLGESLQTASWAQRHEEACIRTPLRPLPELPTTLPLFDRPLTSAERALRCMDPG